MVYKSLFKNVFNTVFTFKLKLIDYGVKVVIVTVIQWDQKD